MTNILSAPLAARIAGLFIAASFLVALFAAFPARAQVTPQEQCTIVRDITIRTFVISKTAIIKPGSDKITAAVGAGVTQATSDWGTICLINTINSVVDWVFLLLLVVAVAFIAIAGFLWMTGGAKPDQQALAGKMIIAAIVGIVIAVLARLLPAVVTGIML
jgi:hypothetical protein